MSLDALGQTRFAYSPLAEVACSLWAREQSPGPSLQPWLRAARASLHSMDLDLLRTAIPTGALAPDFFFMWSTDSRTTIEQQIERVVDLPDEAIQKNLDVVWAGRPMPPQALHLRNGGRPARLRLADAILAYWEVAIAPYWSRIRAVIDDDVSYRATRVLGGGLYELLADLHPEVSLRNRALYVDKPHLPDAFYTDGELTLLPSVFAWPRLIISHDTPGHFDLMYAARGVGRVWESGPDIEAADALGALLGRTRATILTRLAIPLSTTQLAGELSQSPATISQHLSVLRRNGLLTSWRSGRSVLYRRTPLASSIMAVSESETGSGAGELARPAQVPDRRREATSSPTVKTTVW